MNTSQPPGQTSPQQAIRAYQRLGRLLLLVLIGGIGGWSLIANLEGAVIAPGTVTVKANSKRVQHLEGGIVSEILIEEGQAVSKGAVLLKLDTTRDTASLAALDSNLNELIARRARLTAERQQKPAIDFPKKLSDKAASSAKISEILTTQTRLLEARRAAYDGQIDQLKQRVSELGELIKGLSAQQTATGRQLALIEKELKGLATLEEKGLVPQTRLLALQREKASLDGKTGELTASIARAKVQIHETELQMLQLERETMADVLTSLNDTTTRINQLEEQRIALQHKIKRLEIRAPIGGLVHQLAVHTIGGVIAPGDPVLMIVPGSAALIIMAEVNPADIDQVYQGQPVSIRLTAFDQRTTPELEGKVSLVPGDASKDAATGQMFYRVHISMERQELAKLKGGKLIPGMQGEVFIRTKARPVIAYLLQPFTDQLRRAMREP